MVIRSFINWIRGRGPDYDEMLVAADTWGCAPECLLWNYEWQQWAPDMKHTVWVGCEQPFSCVGDWSGNE